MPEAHLFSKVVISGDVVEVYTYSSAIKVGQEWQGRPRQLEVIFDG